MEKVFTTAYSAFIHSSCYFGTVQRTRGVERLSTMLPTERGEVLLSYLRIFTRGKPRKAYECASRRRIPTQSAPTARESQRVGAGSAPIGHYSPWEWFGHQATLWGRGPDWRQYEQKTGIPKSRRKELTPGGVRGERSWFGMALEKTCYVSIKIPSIVASDCPGRCVITKGEVTLQMLSPPMPNTPGRFRRVRPGAGLGNHGALLIQGGLDSEME
ncbi:hypothetical protein KY284_025089 [Solanum tuberosum]|nr:hypothetical protein KY284_025089 [Solanum tuberosum]